MAKNSITENVEVLQDLDKQGKERPWRKHKQKSMELARSYGRLEKMGFIAKGKSTRVKMCGGRLMFESCPQGHEKRLVAAMFCQTRLCPMCAWRRSRMVFSQVMDIIHEAQKQEKVVFITLTLTAKTVDNEEVSDRLDQFFKAWHKMSRRKVFKNAIIGWFRALEVKHNMEKNTYHPHFHCLFAVKPSYFRKDRGKWITQEEWAEMWGHAMGLDYTPTVWVEKVKAKRGRKTKKMVDPEAAAAKAVAEVAKYFTKAEDYIDEDDTHGTDLAVFTLDQALRNRRLVAFGGLFKDIRKQLKQEDVEKADLVKAGDEDESEGCHCTICKSKLEEVFYRWNVGLSQYVKEES